MNTVQQFVLDTKGACLSAAIIAAVKTGIFEEVQRCPHTIDELISDLNLVPDIAQSTINILLADNYLALKENKCVIGDNAIPILERLKSLSGWFDEMNLVLTALPVLDKLLIDPNYENPVKQFWTYKEETKQNERIDVYSKNMDTSQPLHSAAVLKAWNFSTYNTLLELGGGYGAFAMNLAQKYPQLKITVADLPEVIAITVKRVEDAGLSNQITCMGVDLTSINPISGSYDAVIFNRVLHDWPDHHARNFLKKAEATVNQKKGDILIAENMDTTDIPDSSSAATHLMLSLLGGKRRQTKFIENMLLEAGCSTVTIVPCSESILHVAIGHH